MAAAHCALPVVVTEALPVEDLGEGRVELHRALEQIDRRADTALLTTLEQSPRLDELSARAVTAHAGGEGVACGLGVGAEALEVEGEEEIRATGAALLRRERVQLQRVFPVASADRAKRVAFDELGAHGDGCGVESLEVCLLYTSPSPRDRQKSRMPSSA